ncbi:MAG: bifunctional adenosylcobinamide kinase/adenosylcobinamide-phosphate guanylyltransferase [Breznakibacter sp.]
MAHIILVTGGQRSGKSSFAQRMALELSSNPVYLATSRVWDEDHRQRIQRHINDRDRRWTNLEEEKHLATHDLDGRVVLVDCVTLWLTNFFFDNQSDVDKSLGEARAEFDLLAKRDATFIVVTNEIGMGGHGENELHRKFSDLQGWMNQYIAATASEVYLMVSGIPLKVK